MARMSPTASLRKAGMPWPLSRKIRPFWVPAGIRSRTLPFSVVTGTSAPSSASPSVIGSSRSRSAPRRLKIGWGRTRTTTTRSPPAGPWPVSLTRVPLSAPRGIDTSRRLPWTSTRRVVPWNASSSVISATASAVGDAARVAPARPATRPGDGRGGSPRPTAAPSMPMSRRMSSNVWPPVGRLPRPGPLGSVAASREEHPEEVGEVAAAGARRPELVADVAPAAAPGETRERIAGRGPRRPLRHRPGSICSQFAPSMSYFLRFSGSERTAWASLICLKRCSDAASSGLASGWFSRASRRNAFLISAWLAVRGTPSVW